MKLNNAQFITSIANINSYKSYDYPEITFVGRSNVGKSSLINALTNRKKLAKTSSLAGRTRLVNMFLIDKKFMLVDLPGYGYAKASKEAQNEWQSLIGGYLQKSTNLKIVFVLVDLRLMPSELDKEMLNFLYYYNIPFKLVGTKADKLPKSQIAINAKKIALELGLGTDDIIAVSSETKFGINNLLDYISNIVDYDNLIEKEIVKVVKEEKNKLEKSLEKNKKTMKTQIPENKKQKPTSKKVNGNKVKDKSKTNLKDRKINSQTQSQTQKVKKTPRYALKKRSKK